MEAIYFKTNYNFSGEYINEDGELALAYETQKTINKQLELELQDEKAKYKAYEKEYKLEISRLREENEEQRRILSSNLVDNDQTQNELYLKHEITRYALTLKHLYSYSSKTYSYRLTKENLDLLDQKNAINESNKKMKRQYKHLTKRFEGAGIEIEDSHVDNEPTKNTVVGKPFRKVYAIKRQEREYLGMFSYPTGQEAAIMKNLVIREYEKKILIIFDTL